ncbi:MAG TPA: Uma2 family endonuclease [Thermoanaerobaculia bacterium]|nr:Uma2 family endonuclease [Thermoanaerobaculia bacterium]
MALPDVEVHRWTRQEYERAAYAGAFGDRRVELIDGVVYDMPPQGSPHATGVQKARRALDTAFPASQYDIRTQMPLALSRFSMPEPDLAVVPGEPDDYLKAHPKTALLVLEVADSSQYHDRVRKAGIYARAGLQDYWILNLTQDVLEVYRKPARGEYREKLTFHRGERIAPLACPEVTVAVNELLPKRPLTP